MNGHAPGYHWSLTCVLLCDWLPEHTLTSDWLLMTSFLFLANYCTTAGNSCLQKTKFIFCSSHFVFTGFVQGRFRVGDLQVLSVHRFQKRFRHPREAPKFAKTLQQKDPPFKTAVEPVQAFIKEQKKCTDRSQILNTVWHSQLRVDCPVDNREDSLYESLQEERLYEIGKSPIEIRQEIIADEIDYNLNLPSTIKQEAKLTVQKKAKLEGLAFTKMDSIFLADLNGPFDFEDIFPDDPWIENTDIPVQNLEIPEHSAVTAQEVLEETILSPDVNVLGAVEEPDHFFSEQFINLATMESNINSLATATMAGFKATENMNMGNFDELLANVKQDVSRFDFEAQNLHDHVSPESIPETDLTAAVVPDVMMIPENVPSLPGSPVDTTDSGIFANDFSLDMDQLDPAIVKLLENLERSEETTVKPDSKKRGLLEVSESANWIPASKKTKSQSCSSEEGVSGKVAVRRMKNNEASRICRASRKARHNELFDQEKRLAVENKELAAKVKELSATVEYLRNHLVVKLSGQHN